MVRVHGGTPYALTLSPKQKVYTYARLNPTTAQNGLVLDWRTSRRAGAQPRSRSFSRALTLLRFARVQEPSAKPVVVSDTQDLHLHDVARDDETHQLVRPRPPPRHPLALARFALFPRLEIPSRPDPRPLFR